MSGSCSWEPSELKQHRTPFAAQWSIISASLPRGYSVMSVQDFVSRVTLTDSQREELPSLEPSFEHLLHDAKVDPATIQALRHCQITDRETFAALDDTVDGLKTVALDMGIDLTGGGMPHKREFARITTAWKKARAQAEIKVTTEALQRQHGEPIAMLPEDWTSVVVQFKKKYGTDLPDEELLAQAYYEDFQERLSAGMLRAESLDQVISMAEAEEQERQKTRPAEAIWNPPRFQAYAADTTTVHRHSSEEHGRAVCKIRGHEQHVALGSATTAGPVTVLGPAANDVPAIPEAAARQRRLRSQERISRKVPHGALLGALYVI